MIGVRYFLNGGGIIVFNGRTANYHLVLPVLAFIHSQHVPKHVLVPNREERVKSGHED